LWQKIMNIASFKELLNDIGNEIGNDYQVWLSSDAEGNQLLPMSQTPELCLAVDKDEKRIILFPLHC